MEMARRLNGQSMRKVAAGADLYHSRLSEAATILDWAPDLAADVAAAPWPGWLDNGSRVLVQRHLASLAAGCFHRLRSHRSQAG